MGRTVLAVIPARGGSKGVPLKNIHPLAGRPLLAHTADVVHEAGWFDRTVVSTDHPAIAEVARAVALEVPFLRPPDLSGDRIGDRDVLVHALHESERAFGRQFDIIVMLQPTSPLRKAAHVEKAVRQLIDGDWDAVWTVSATPLKYHPLKQLDLDAAGRLTYFDGRGGQIIARQQLGDVFYRNGVAYAFTRKCLVELDTLLPERCGATVLDGTFISIDTLDDFADVEHELARRHKEEPA